MQPNKLNMYFNSLIAIAVALISPNSYLCAQQGGQITIQGIMEGQYADEDIHASVYDDLLLPTTKHLQLQRTAQGKVDTTGRFTIVLPHVDAVRYLSLSQGTHNGRPIPILDLVPISPGDSIWMQVQVRPDPMYSKQFSDSGRPRYRYGITFSGRGHDKLRCKYGLDTLERTFIAEALAEGRAKATLDPSGVYLGKRILDRRLGYLEQHRYAIGEQAYGMLRAEVLANGLKAMHADLQQYPSDRIGRALYLDGIELIHRIPLSILESSPFVNRMLLSATDGQDIALQQGLLGSLLDNAMLRDRLYAAYLLENWKAVSTDGTATYYRMLDSIRSPHYRAWIEARFAGRASDVLHDLVLTDEAGKDVSLAALKGKVVFMDFYYTGCGNCITYYQNTVSRAEAHFEGNDDVVFVAVSIDGRREKWLGTLRGGAYSSKDALNLYTGGRGAEHPIIQKLNITKYPSPILIDRRGGIATTSFLELGQESYQVLIDRIAREL